MITTGIYGINVEENAITSHGLLGAPILLTNPTSNNFKVSEEIIAAVEENRDKFKTENDLLEFIRIQQLKS